MKNSKVTKPWYKKFWVWLLIFSCWYVLFDASTSIWEKIVICVCIILLIMGNTNSTDKDQTKSGKTATQSNDIALTQDKPKVDDIVTNSNTDTHQITKVSFLGKIKEKREQKRIEKAKKAEELRIQQQQAEEARQRDIAIWQNEDLTQYACKVNGLILRKNEFCYLSVDENIIWSEDRVRSKRTNYSGPTATIHIAKGLNYRLGSISAKTEKYSEITPIFNGGLYLTNKRIFLVNNQGTKALVLSGIVSVTPYSDGTELFRQSGKRILLTGFSDAAKFNIYLQRILNDNLVENYEE
ncbi:hypothetical protein OZX69_05960 [Lactobacillus sp. ESL0731]|uniref:hypothetical protein n=1 Tax=unclassified Lactobacillus TaxID=2620435 RepID=UPI0023F83645|nr:MULTISPECIES: hypothetical protein [unclassified Lactobacillus]WEV50506.1 hypothetical protein OZX63_05955 [Lactobacillus sp. ESL0700]WEV61636.1 hypothetical protein OZX69_05960 [Lactobacillus sp. ESL0731]